jgi:tRNA uridine 5-carboxymethylaminomethyl modification enzyme
MPGFYDYYDVAVVGAGHAGIEAALAAARMGLKTVLITQTPDSIARMSCNPSIGGIAKGNIVREIDALGGEMAKLIDRSMIQFRMLNKRRGPAVQAPRSQADKITYSRLARQVCEQTENLYTLMDTVIDILTTASETPLPPNSDSAADKGTIPGEKRGYSGSNIDNPDYATEAARSGMRQKVTGLVTERGRIIPVRSVVLTTGTFLGGRIFIGEYDAPCGRVGEPAAYGLTASLHRLGFTTGRLKTGTPPRILKRTIDFDKLELEPGDEEVIPFSFEDEKVERPMVPCHIVYTNEETHKIIRDNIGRSPLYSGKISGIGPRYCPSIEDKVMRFKERDRHQIFVEPEGLETEEMYLNGLSSSLPECVQDAFMRTMHGFENAVQSRPGYAVEYDFVEPTQLFPSLETKRVAGLFDAGQINGTSGYEEAAAQGLLAGINAIRYLQNKEMITLSRESSYLGTLVDDLVTKDIDEPYRMLTSRSEYRLLLRQDNADERLTKIGYEAGLIDEERYQNFLKKQETIENEIKRLLTQKISPSEKVNEALAKYNEHIDRGLKLSELLKRPNVSYETLIDADEETKKLALTRDVYEQVEVKIKYDGYIKRQIQQVSMSDKLEKIKIPEDIDYKSIQHISIETRDKLMKVRPKTLGQATRIGGVKPADISVLMVIIESYRLKEYSNSAKE